MFSGHVVHRWQNFLRRHISGSSSSVAAVGLRELNAIPDAYKMIRLIVSGVDRTETGTFANSGNLMFVIIDLNVLPIFFWRVKDIKLHLVLKIYCY